MNYNTCYGPHQRFAGKSHRKMDVGRLGYIRRQEHKRWKLVFMLNHVLNSHGKVVTEVLNTEKFELGVKYDKSFVPVRKSIVKQLALQHCLRKRRESKPATDRNIGVYGGKPLYSYAREIDKLISEMHPKLRRLKQTEKALKFGIERGKLLDPSQTPSKIEHIFAKRENVKTMVPSKDMNYSKLDKDVLQNTKLSLPQLVGPIPTYRKKMDSHNNSDVTRATSNQTFELEKKYFANKRQTSVLDGKVSIESTTRENSVLAPPGDRQFSRESSKGLLILPPIQPTKQMVQRW